MTNEFNTPQLGDSTPPDWEIQAKARDRLHSEMLSQNKTALFDALVTAGITHITVTFDGYGDSGQIEEVTAKIGDDTIGIPAVEIECTRVARDELDLERCQLGIDKLIENLAYDLLEKTHDGWENNDGAFGDFTFDVATRTITLDYNERYTSSENYTHEF